MNQHSDPWAGLEDVDLFNLLNDEKEEEEPQSKRLKTDTEESSVISTSKFSNPKIVLEKIISGGQTGADQAALNSARKAFICTGGTAPPGFMTSKGPDRFLRTFGLVALERNGTRNRTPLSGFYVQRSQKNINDSDGTIAFRTRQSKGTDLSISFCFTGNWKLINIKKVNTEPSKYKPILVLSECVEEGHENNLIYYASAFNQVVDFLVKHKIKILNICGHRTETFDKKFGDRVELFLDYVFTRLVK